MGAFYDLYFALTSRSGTWSFSEMRSWQTDAGLVPRKTDPAPLCPRDRPPGSGSRLGVSGVGHQWAVA